MQVSVIVLTYNPNLEKLYRTLSSIIAQKDVDFELILSDDGSADSKFPQAEAFLQLHGFSNYHLVSNPQNCGTVQNCISGLSASRGEYVFLTSPGDLLFDDYVLADFVRFAQQNTCSMCFGNAVHYNCTMQGLELTSHYTTPKNPNIFERSRSLAFRKSCYCNRKWITGAVFFRERTAAIHYFTAIAPASIYTEDTPSTLFAMAEQNMPIYYDRNMIWYESGGISTGGNSKWTALIDQDIRTSVEALKLLYPQDPYVDVAWTNACIPNRFKRLAYKLFRHPIIMSRSYWATYCIPPKTLVCTSDDMHRLYQLTKTSDETR